MTTMEGCVTPIREPGFPEDSESGEQNGVYSNVGFPEDSESGEQNGVYSNVMSPDLLLI